MAINRPNKTGDKPTDDNEKVQFNKWKHHLGFVKQRLTETTSLPQLDILNKEIVLIGDSLMDLYTGALSPDTIIRQSVEVLKDKGFFEYTEYKNWIESERIKYRKISISDNSDWVFRMGNNPDKYIHLHPGKYSPHTIRVRSLTLKTAVLTTAYARITGKPIFDKVTVNNARNIYLNEPPVKSIGTQKGLGKILLLLNDVSE